MTGCPESERVGKFCEPTWSRVYVTKATVAVAVVVAVVTIVVVITGSRVTLRRLFAAAVVAVAVIVAVWQK